MLQIIYWDEAAFYVEQQFVRCSDNFICFIGLTKQTVIGAKPSDILRKLNCSVDKPELPPELESWITSINHSSERLRKKL